MDWVGPGLENLKVDRIISYNGLEPQTSLQPKIQEELVKIDVSATDLLFRATDGIGAVSQLAANAVNIDGNGVFSPPNVPNMFDEPTLVRSIITAADFFRYPAGFASMAFNDLASQTFHSNPILSGLSSGVGAAIGLSSIKGSIQSFADALERGDLLTALQSGANITHAALSTYRSALMVEYQAVANAGVHDIAWKNTIDSQLSAIDSVLNGLGEYLPILNMLASAKNGSFAQVFSALADLAAPSVAAAQSTELKQRACKPAKDEAWYERDFWAWSAPGCAESSSARASAASHERPERSRRPPAASLRCSARTACSLQPG